MDNPSALFQTEITAKIMMVNRIWWQVHAYIACNLMAYVVGQYNLFNKSSF